ncbi:MAG: PhoH family protein [Planctomycetota bacterium]
MKITRKIRLPSGKYLIDIFGPYDSHLKLIRDECGVGVAVHDRDIKIIGADRDVAQASNILYKLISSSRPVNDAMVADLINKAKGRDETPEQKASSSSVGAAKITIQPKTEGQARYLEAMQNNEIVFSIGPAGTGKTYLAVAQALTVFKQNGVRKIILCRPAVEAGERLGFLPGDYQEKVNPYLRPLYDALGSFIEYQQLRRLIDNNIIEVIPLAYMRGRSLNNAFIILDEAQNTTSDQMKMFLTRMGNGSRIVVTGDITQIDLPPGKVSGLVEVQAVLGDTKGVAFPYLTKADIVRHPLVQDIVDAYESRRSIHKKK